MHSLVMLAIMWAAVFVAAIAAHKTRLTPVLWFLFIGAILVNVGILPEDPDPFIRGFAELGIVVIMFALGFEENISNFLSSIKRSWGIALFGGLAPFTATYLVTNWFFDDHAIALMCGLAMTATAVSLTMVSLHSEGLGKSRVAMRIMTSAVLDDIASLALVAILVPIAAGETTPGLQEILIVVFKTVAFFGVMAVMGSWLLPHDLTGWVGRIPGLGRLGIKDILAGAEGEYSTLTVLLLALSIGLLGHAFGFHPAVGAYMAGLLLKEEYFLKGERGSAFEATRGIIDSAAFTWIGPVFFVSLGTQLVFEWERFVSLIPETLILTGVLATAQIVAAAVAARYTGGMRWAGSVMIGLGMLGRAELAFVVIDIAYVQNQILNEDAFYLLMFTAFLLNIAVPLSIRWWKPRYERDLVNEPAGAEADQATPRSEL